MITLQIVDGSLQVSNNGSIILVAPKNSCAIDVLSLYDAIPLAVIYNKYLGTSTNIFTQPLANCQNSVGTPFTVNSFIAFAEANLGFDTVGGGCGGGSSPFEYNANATGIQPILVGNIASGVYSTIGGGVYNCAIGITSTIGGGCTNIANAIGSTVSGGVYNTANADCSTVGGGDTNNALGSHSTIGGGLLNCIIGNYTTVGGGYENKIIGSSNNSTIGGGRGNCICSQGSVIAGGGSYNAINNIISAYSNFSSILGGYQNTASAYYSTIGGGKTNIASGTLSFIGGGELNTASSGHSTISGGRNNTASGGYSTIVGGRNNNTYGCDDVIIAGTNITANRIATTFVSNLSIMSIPTSSANLPSGAVWSDSGILNIVP
jgi:hypothetical protein